MYITRLLFSSNSGRNSSTLRSLLGTLILSSCSRSLFLSSSRPSSYYHRHHLVQHFHQNVHRHHQHCSHLRLARNVTSLPQLASPIHTSSPSVLLSELEGIPSPNVSPDDSSVASDSKANIEPASPTGTKPTTSLTITDRCRARLQSVLDPDEVLRIGVKGGGCSGFEYEISVVKADTINPAEDIRFEDKVVVDSESIEYMNGAQLDYEEELIRSGFRVVANPLAEKGCSCGASFSLKF